ncbi:tellurite resistance/C4-dicarboxylate transporter family protein [Paeniglutamicibacter cryotolerans]|uniref:Tellurite resistance protein TehA-like permease n=1 Tax=Paeniglutamicibacter cryotolerans TaxID=670079 RepID=A0A839QGY9_9MICC|nr:tellurite resistance/C4-dicarboxylate transporter family protein [Paeniglutamicibacter cryotolerans]MBB2994863.1 tellurite resistance protein TehA-like permease [Paeniglutamicibacter cryotolerans]
MPQSPRSVRLKPLADYLIRHHSRIDAAVAGLPPSAFSFVMATGILSTGLDLGGQAVAAWTLFWIAVAAGAMLTIGFVWRAISHPDRFMADLWNPGTMFGYFTIVAAANVLGLHYDMAGYPAAGRLLAVLAGIFWLFLTYAIPASLLLRERQRPVLDDANGSWFLWVVATQSMATALAVVALTTKTQFVGAVATGMWGVGVMLYLIIATLVTLRMLTRPNKPENLSPTYWIFMGATAITVLAGAKVLAMPADFAASISTDGFVAGASYVLWSVGMWWIPLLLVFGFWRHAVRRYPLRYETSLWAIVFPLGMLSAATIFFGANEQIPEMIWTGKAGVWVAVAAWIAATSLMVGKYISWLRAGMLPRAGKRP